MSKEPRERAVLTPDQGVSSIHSLIQLIDLTPALAGSDGTEPAVSMLKPAGATNTLFEVDNNGNLVIRLKTGETLKASMVVAVTAAKKVYVTVFGGDF